MSLNPRSPRTGAGQALAAAGMLSMAIVVAALLSLPAAPAAENASQPAVTMALPVGSIVAYGGDAAKAAALEEQGWMLCDGRELRANVFTELHAAIGQAWGGDPQGTSFRIPDLRGRFLRGTNLGAVAEERDPDAALRIPSASGGNAGDAVGSLQEDATGPHYHSLAGVADAAGPGFGAEWVRFRSVKVPDESAPVVTNGWAVQPGPGKETRPRNVAVNWIIRVR